MLRALRYTIEPQNIELKMMNADFFSNLDELVKSLILLAPQAILGFMTRLAKLQELGRTPSNSLQFLTPAAS